MRTRWMEWMGHGLLLLLVVWWGQSAARAHAAEDDRVPVVISVTTLDGVAPLPAITIRVVDVTGNHVTEAVTDDHGVVTVRLAQGGYGLAVDGTLPDGTPIRWEPIYQARGIQPLFVTDDVIPLTILVAPDGIALVGVTVIGDPLRGPGSDAAVLPTTPPPVPVALVPIAQIETPTAESVAIPTGGPVNPAVPSVTVVSNSEPMGAPVVASPAGDPSVPWQWCMGGGIGLGVLGWWSWRTLHTRAKKR